jgi:hypothetical protein
MTLFFLGLSLGAGHFWRVERRKSAFWRQAAMKANASKSSAGGAA